MLPLELSSRSAGFRRPAPASDSAARNRRKQRVLAIVAKGFPVPQGRVFELLQLLSAPVIDLRGVSAAMRTESRLKAQIFGLLRCAPFEEYHRAPTLSEAVVLLGSERLRVLAWACALANFAGRRLPVETMRAFWHHSILTGLLSERIAREVRPDAAENAYLGGLLHDLGRLPLLVVAHEIERAGEELPTGLHDSPFLERSYFGVDHCEVGRWIAISGNFSPWMTDVIQHHHAPSLAPEDPTLAAIVAASDRCCPVAPGPCPSAETGWQKPVISKEHGELLLRLRPPALLEADQAAQSRFVKNSDLYTPFPRFGFC